MENNEEDRLELLERQLSDKVTERVRSALFKLYATVGAAVIFVIGFVSWDIVDDIKDELKKEYIKEIDADIDAKRKRIDEQVIESKLVSDRVNQTIHAIDQRLIDYQAKIDKIDRTYERVNRIYEQVEELDVDAKNFIDIYEKEVAPLSASVKTLSNQIAYLAEQVIAIDEITLSENRAMGDGALPEATVNRRQVAIQSVINQTDQTKQAIEDARERNTVFFQFATATRNEAEELSSRLKIAGFHLPGEERTDLAHGRNEVRFFHEEDEKAAQALARATSKEVASMGYAYPDIGVKDFTAYSKKKPREGVLELWLDLSSNRFDAGTR